MSKEEKMYMQMLPIVDDVYRIFNYIAISKEDYEKMSKSILGELMNGKNDLENIENLYRTRLYDEMLRLGKELISSQEGAYVLVNNFVNRRFKNIVKIDGVKSGFKKLDMVLCSYGFMPGIDLLNKLIQENVIVNRLLKMFFDYYSPQIAIGRLEKITDSNTLITLCQLYASLNNLDIKLFEDNDDENDYNYDEVSNVDIIRTYFLEMTRIPLLTLEQERDLAKRVARGDDEARELLIVSNLRLVVKFAKRYVGRGLPFLDLIQEGNIGIMKAVDEFDVNKGYRFSTYASCWIRQAITRAIANTGRNIRLPVHLSIEVGTYVKTKDTLMGELGREPTAMEIAKAMNISLSKVYELCKYQNDTISMHILIDTESETELGDFFATDDDTPEDVVVETMARLQLPDMIEKLFTDCQLNERERSILVLRSTLNGRKRMTLDEVGEAYGVTRERIRQIEKRALLKLRRYVKYYDNIDDFIETYDGTKKIKIKKG